MITVLNTLHVTTRDAHVHSHVHWENDTLRVDVEYERRLQVRPRHLVRGRLFGKFMVSPRFARTGADIKLRIAA